MYLSVYPDNKLQNGSGGTGDKLTTALHHE